MDTAVEFFEICNEPNGNTAWYDVTEYCNIVIPVGVIAVAAAWVFRSCRRSYMCTKFRTWGSSMWY